MRVKAVSVLVVLFLCLSLLPMLAPPLASLVKANPMDTLTVIWTVTSTTPANFRPHNLQTGDNVIQFCRSSFVVGESPTGSFGTGEHMDYTVSGDFVGEGSSVSNSLDVECSKWPDGTPPGNGKGYCIGKPEFHDDQGNRVEFVIGEDLDLTFPSAGGVNSSYNGYVLSTSCTGPDFDGQVLIGTLSGSGSQVNGVPVNSTMTMHLRRYSAAEVSAPVALSGASSGTGTPTVRNLGASSGPQTDDEFVRFTTDNNIFVPSGTAAIYVCGGGGAPGTFSGGLTGSFTGSGDSIMVFGTNPADQGWAVSTSLYQDDNGTFAGITLTDLLGPTGPDTYTARAYTFALMENATKGYAGKDYYFVTDSTSWSTGKVEMSVSFYTLIPPGVPTATPDGAMARFVPSSGSMQNLTAVSVDSLPAEAIAAKPDIQFPDGLFQFNITGLTPGESVTLTIILPSAVPAGAQYWKYGPTPSDPSPHWYQIAMGDNDGDNVITITLTDNGLGDDVLTGADGVIVDQGGPGWPGPAGGAHGAPVFPSIYIGIGAALGAGIVAYFVRRRMVAS